jgi:hypothetical protein
MRSRRHILKALAASLLPAFARLDCPADVRPYRADAVLMLGSLPIYRRRGVGSGYAVCRRVETDAGAAWLLGFAGGSWPQRARGLNRLGYYCEVVSSGAESAPTASYFGFLTVSEEADLAEARRSLDAGHPTAAFSVIAGQVGRVSLCRLARFSAPAELGWPQWSTLLAGALEAIRSPRLICQDAAGAGPFLHAVREAIDSPASHRSQRFVYGGYAHRLETAKRPAPHLAERYGRPVLVLSGAVHSGRTGNKSRFKLWLEDDPAATLPLRIELQPRSFLRLSFEYDPSVVEQDVVERVPFGAGENQLPL